MDLEARKLDIWALNEPRGASGTPTGGLATPNARSTSPDAGSGRIASLSVTEETLGEWAGTFPVTKPRGRSGR
jgi:hypothetical protein